MEEQSYAFGLIGLGVMGRNLALNMADHRFPVVVFNRTDSVTDAFITDQAEKRPIRAAHSLEDLVAGLSRPRSIMLMISAGPGVDRVLDSLVPLLTRGDVLIDGGNSHFSDTDSRQKRLGPLGLAYLGVGVSGGEKGARLGPSIMPGGPADAYELVRRCFEAMAAQVEGEPCVTYLGKGSAGHYVKMVHNGIEYALMQLIAESYDLMKSGLGLDNDRLHEVFSEWNRSELKGYLIEITAEIFSRNDNQTGARLIDLIVDEAEQTGTGMWMSQDALNLGVPVPTIDAAVTLRNVSAARNERQAMDKLLSGPQAGLRMNADEYVPRLKNALYAATVMAYAQGIAQLFRASAAYGYGLDLGAVARVWRGGCIIRAALLEEFRAAFAESPGLDNLLKDPRIAQAVSARVEDLRAVVGFAGRSGIPAGAFMSTLAYYDALRSSWLPANLIQAQRDYFGAHRYKRVDKPGTDFHTEWETAEKATLLPEASS